MNVFQIHDSLSRLNRKNISRRNINILSAVHEIDTTWRNGLKRSVIREMNQDDDDNDRIPFEIRHSHEWKRVQR